MKRLFLPHDSVSIMTHRKTLVLSLFWTVADFQKLHEAKEVLCDEAKRKNYDLWKRSGVAISFHEWQALNDSVKTSMHWAVRTKKEPMLEACKPEDPFSSQAEDRPCKEASEIPSNDASSCK
uniref:DnaJ homolog subfamily C member 12-like n=1 Tax=Fundulus heteroclitus TaxID=8078 RepID=A0A3Q2Q096_FUNHE